MKERNTKKRIMKGYRYNSEKREDRKFNTCGMEKNPNNVKFYASNMDYAQNYRYVRDEDGDIIYECSLETVEIENVNLFDMVTNFKKLNTYKSLIDAEIGLQLRDYTKFMNEATKASERKMWAKSIEELNGREIEIAKRITNLEFQPLSDFATQNELIAELRSLGFDGYTTNNEIAIF